MVPRRGEPKVNNEKFSRRERQIEIASTMFRSFRWKGKHQLKGAKVISLNVPCAAIKDFLLCFAKENRKTFREILSTNKAREMS